MTSILQLQIIISLLLLLIFFLCVTRPWLLNCFHKTSKNFFSFEQVIFRPIDKKYKLFFCQTMRCLKHTAMQKISLRHTTSRLILIKTVTRYHKIRLYSQCSNSKPPKIPYHLKEIQKMRHGLGYGEIFTCINFNSLALNY